VSAEDGSSMTTGCCVIVTLHCHSQIAVRVGWGFSFCTADLLTSVASVAIGLEGRSVMVRPGDNEFRCRIPYLPFRPGIYAVRGGLTDLATFTPIALLGYQNAPCFFTVEADHSDGDNNLLSQTNGLVTIPAEWLSTGEQL
jgi:hypothetical protein